MDSSVYSVELYDGNEFVACLCYDTPLFGTAEKVYSEVVKNGHFPGLQEVVFLEYYTIVDEDGPHIHKIIISRHHDGAPSEAVDNISGINCEACMV